MSIPTTLAAGAVIATGSIRLLPFYVPSPVTISDLGTRVTTLAAAGTFQLAIYAMDPSTKLPTGTPVATTGGISTGAATVVAGDIVGANVTLAAGWYYQAIAVDSSAGGVAIFQTFAGAVSHTGALIGSPTQINLTGSATVVALIHSFAGTYGSWPNLTGQTMVEVGANSSCVIHFKVA